MNTALQLQGFFKDISRDRIDPYKFWNSYVYIALNEWHWSYDEICDAPIPFIIEALNFRAEMKKKEEKESKRKR